MELDHRSSTSVHEAAHAAVSHLIGEKFAFVEVTDAHNGIMMPFHSPCAVCNSEVPEHRACGGCMMYYEKHDPRLDNRSKQISRAYRVEAAVASAGEMAELKFNRGVLLANAEELLWDRQRVSTRASLRHLWQEDACNNHREGEGDRDCATCNTSAHELRLNVETVLFATQTWSAVLALAHQLAKTHRMAGDDVVKFLEERGVGFGSIDIDTLWPPLP